MEDGGEEVDMLVAYARLHGLGVAMKVGPSLDHRELSLQADERGSPFRGDERAGDNGLHLREHFFEFGVERGDFRGRVRTPARVAAHPERVRPAALLFHGLFPVYGILVPHEHAVRGAAVKHPLRHALAPGFLDGVVRGFLRGKEPYPGVLSLDPPARLIRVLDFGVPDFLKNLLVLR